jgi:phosphoglycolate phosphatase-like HAD superfamily hydrolase
MKSLPAAGAYVFDIDGTLLVTQDLVHWNALHRAMLEAYGVDAAIDGIPYHGMTDISILRAAVARAGISNDGFDSGLPVALEVVCREVETNRQQIVPQICPGIPALLMKLRQQGALLGVASGNLETVGWHKIEAAGLRDYFSFGFFSDESERRADIFRNAKNHAAVQLGAKAHVCFVGDTPSDIHAAKEVGALIVSVASGTFTHAELSAYSPDLCLNSCADLVLD